jgi:hypothetical protein
MDQAQQPSQQRGKDWVKVEESAVPYSLKETLNDDKYKGWKNSGVYYNKTTKQYSIDAMDNGRLTTHTFDANGKAATNSNTANSMSGDNDNSNRNKSDNSSTTPRSDGSDASGNSQSVPQSGSSTPNR